MNKLQVKITRKNYKGGGGGSDTVENVPEWARPYIESVMGTSQGLYQSGQLNQVAGPSAGQQAAFGVGQQGILASTGSGMDALSEQQQRLKQMASSGGYDTSAIKDKAILESGKATAEMGKAYGAGGTLGSARQAVQQGAQNAQTAANFANIDYDAAQRNFQNKMTAEQGIGQNVSGQSQLTTGTAAALAGLGQQDRGIQQQQLDSSWQGLQRFASSVYGNPARQSQESSGGK